MGREGSALTGVEIKREAEAYIEEFIDDPDALVFINRVLNMIGDMALIYEVVTGTIEYPYDWYELPPTLTNVRKVETSGGVPFHDYEVVDNWIRFPSPGQYTIHYRRLPKPLTGILDTPEIHPAFHSALVTGLIALWKLKDDDENPDGVRNYHEFKEHAMRVYNTLQRSRTPSTVKVVR